MDTWKAFEANELTHSATHHLFAIHEVGAEYGGWARVSDIARHLHITRGSVSINLRALKKRGWVDTDDRHLVKLSPDGLKVVQTVLAKRSVLKTFFVRVLAVPEPQAEIDACKMEHLVSHTTGRQLAQFLRFLAARGRDGEALLSRFRRFHAQCPARRTCDLCQGQCLVDELAEAM
ncbi:MAG: metal-dependent transcriptional regulator [Acidobacteria bacterium]|nr:metal-dependent transcriptional regulator [Acidobacteriota bacterium]